MPMIFLTRAASEDEFVKIIMGNKEVISYIQGEKNPNYFTQIIFT
jgi:hypothetical protein